MCQTRNSRRYFLLAFPSWPPFLFPGSMQPRAPSTYGLTHSELERERGQQSGACTVPHGLGGLMEVNTPLPKPQCKIGWLTFYNPRFLAPTQPRHCLLSETHPLGRQVWSRKKAGRNRKGVRGNLQPLGTVGNQRGSAMHLLLGADRVESTGERREAAPAWKKPSWKAHESVWATVMAMRQGQRRPGLERRRAGPRGDRTSHLEVWHAFTQAGQAMGLKQRHCFPHC